MNTLEYMSERSIQDENRMPPLRRACRIATGAAMFVLAIVFATKIGWDEVLGYRWLFVFVFTLGGMGCGCIFDGVRGVEDPDIQYVCRIVDETCPRCGGAGTLELYERWSERTRSMQTHRLVTRTAKPMVNCVNVNCSYREEYDRRVRLMASLVETYRNEDASSLSGPSSTMSPEERALQAVDAIEEEERRDNLRRRRAERRWGWTTHHESNRLEAEGFGSCPDCSGHSVKFSRSMYKSNSPSGLASIAECTMPGCGYISTLMRHKRTVGRQIDEEDVDEEQHDTPSDQMWDFLRR